jgi:hypothetical protein
MGKIVAYEIAPDTNANIRTEEAHRDKRGNSLLVHEVRALVVVHNMVLLSA